MFAVFCSPPRPASGAVCRDAAWWGFRGWSCAGLYLCCSRPV